jgi:CRISPR/Cas system-associated protein Cas10 (large subunit of type III CRISPR-Cas system)
MERNPNRKQLCAKCGGRKPQKRRPRHMAALDITYEEFVVLNGGERCAICLRERSEKDRRLQRDHDHFSGRPRGLLCVRCNRALPAWMTPEWLRAAADYLEKAREAA